MRVWIETGAVAVTFRNIAVTLYVRVWIETARQDSHPSGAGVTLYVRVWIETYFGRMKHRNEFRSPST